MRPYHALRFQVLPGPAAEEHAARLARFCRQHGVGEVLLFVAGEELADGHPAHADEDAWFESVAVATKVLQGEGLTVSLNPWQTTGHADRGRRDRMGFAPMVSPLGEVATAQASFACPRWRDWLVGHYGRFAALGFRTLWLEDDFRFHNHAPLTWGGGFEPEMLARFAVLAGREVDRVELVAAITAPGEPHPWRALLARTWREAQLEVAAALRAAIDGRAALGLMSSNLGVASVEGRDWGRLFAELGPGVVHRPHYAPYTEAPGSALARSVAMLDLQRGTRPAGIEVAPEVENYPYGGWAKSDTQTWSEMVACALSGADGLLLNLMSFTAVVPDPAVGDLLDASRPALDAAASPADQETIGVGLPWYADTAAHVRTAQGGDLAALDVDPLRAASFLLPYGVPVRAGEAPVTALFGDLAWAVPDEDVARLLGRGLLLDGVAAAILTERGYGPSTGVWVHETQGRDALTPYGPYSMDRVTEVAPGTDAGLLRSHNQQTRVVRMTASPSAEVWAEVLTPRLEKWGDGMVAYRNREGGRVVVLAACEPEDLPRSKAHQSLLHQAIRFLEGEPAMPLVSGGPHLIPHAARTASGVRVAVANGSPDPARPVVDVPASWGSPARERLLAPLVEPSTVDGPVPYRGYAVRWWDA